MKVSPNIIISCKANTSNTSASTRNYFCYCKELHLPIPKIFEYFSHGGVVALNEDEDEGSPNIRGHRCVKTVWKSDFQNTTNSLKELVESSAVNGEVWKSYFQKRHKSSRELVESSAAWKTVSNSRTRNGRISKYNNLLWSERCQSCANPRNYFCQCTELLLPIPKISECVCLCEEILLQIIQSEY